LDVRIQDCWISTAVQLLPGFSWVRGSSPRTTAVFRIQNKGVMRVLDTRIHESLFQANQRLNRNGNGALHGHGNDQKSG
jgi:hypothetical protein